MAGETPGLLALSGLEVLPRQAQCLTHGCPVKHSLNWTEFLSTGKGCLPGSVPLLGNVPFSCLWLGLSLGVFLRALHSLTLWECIRSHYDQWNCPPANLIWSKRPALSGCYFSLASSPFCIWVLASVLIFFSLYTECWEKWVAHYSSSSFILDALLLCSLGMPLGLYIWSLGATVDGHL